MTVKAKDVLKRKILHLKILFNKIYSLISQKLLTTMVTNNSSCGVRLAEPVWCEDILRADKCQESSTNNNLAESIKNSNLIIHIQLRASTKSDFNSFAKIKT